MTNFFNVLEVDFSRYPPLHVLLLGFGFIFWVMAYKEVITGVIKNKMVEIPIIVCAMDISWEFLWAFFLENDFGILFTIGCTVWFFMDVGINYSVLRYGKKLVTNPWIKKNYYFIYVFILIGSGSITYFLKTSGIDNGLGLLSAYLINLVISATYIYQLLSFPQFINHGFQYRVAWTKFLGTGSISIFCFLHYPNYYLLYTMCIMVFAMDILYIYLFKNYKAELS